jgi:hypothetical protein
MSSGESAEILGLASRTTHERIREINGDRMALEQQLSRNGITKAEVDVLRNPNKSKLLTVGGATPHI